VNGSADSVVAIIPARGGSDRIPRKNVALLAGEPLIAHTLRHAASARHVSEIYVSTDDDEIADISAHGGACIVRRPGSISGAKASSESALLHVLDERRRTGLADPDLVVFLQCTSPVRESDDIDRAVETLIAEDADSLLSVCRNARFIWHRVGDSAESYNYDYRHRKMEQDLDPQFVENGSIYLSRTGLLRETGNRLGGRIALHVMDYWSAFQVDEPEDLALIDWILTKGPRGSAAYS